MVPTPSRLYSSSSSPPSMRASTRCARFTPARHTAQAASSGAGRPRSYLHFGVRGEGAARVKEGSWRGREESRLEVVGSRVASQGRHAAANTKAAAAAAAAGATLSPAVEVYIKLLPAAAATTIARVAAARVACGRGGAGQGSSEQRRLPTASAQARKAGLLLSKPHVSSPSRTSLQLRVQQRGGLLRGHAPQHGLRVRQRQPEGQVQRLAVGRRQHNELVCSQVDRRARRDCRGAQDEG